MSNQVPTFDDFPDIKDPQFRDTLALYFKRLADSVNTKEGALYQPQELATFQKYFTVSDPQKNRNVYRKVVDIGALPNSGVKTVVHEIAFDADSTLTRLYGAATDPTGLNYIPLPYASATLVNNIELSLDGTNVIITTGSNRSAFTRCTVVIEWTKNL